jgi:hypothetical protein
VTRQTLCNSCERGLTSAELDGTGILICEQCRQRTEAVRRWWQPVMHWDNGGRDGLKLASVVSVPWESPRVSLIAITADGGINAAYSLDGKRRLLAQAGDDGMLLVAWPGDRRQDVFIVDDRQAARRAITR